MLLTLDRERVLDRGMIRTILRRFASLPPRDCSPIEPPVQIISQHLNNLLTNRSFIRAQDARSRPADSSEINYALIVRSNT